MQERHTHPCFVDVAFLFNFCIGKSGISDELGLDCHFMLEGCFSGTPNGSQSFLMK